MLSGRISPREVRGRKRKVDGKLKSGYVASWNEWDSMALSLRSGKMWCLGGMERACNGLEVWRQVRIGTTHPRQEQLCLALLQRTDHRVCGC